MDVDAFVAANQADWSRLQQLTQLARHADRLAPGDVDELTRLYQRCVADLAQARVAYAADPQLIGRLTLLVGDTHQLVYGQRDGETRRALARFVTTTFPAAVISLRWYVLAASVLTFVPWAVFQVWLSISPRAFDVVAPDAVKEAYIHHDFAAYYSSQPAQNFATQVFLNNVRVAFLAFAAGILLCVVTAYVLAQNGANGGKAGGLFTHAGEAGNFWGLILPHGLLELSAVVVAGAAGLRIGWTLIDPGDRTRVRALAAEARRAGNVLTGLIAAFLLAAAIEGFVTGRPWSTAVRVGIGVAAFVAFWGWTIVLGIRRRDDLDATGIDDHSRPEALSVR